MASRSLGPGAALLRASRVFSVPPPLAPPADQINTAGNFSSDSATLPYPTHMSITTPASSLQKGDWGLKRSLPLRSTTKSSTPVIKVKAMDTWEHITEFASAGDHTLTLQKWQEMGVPITAPVTKARGSNFSTQASAGRSVFEDDLDTIHNEKNLGLQINAKRWKFKGPWLAGQTDGEFNQYVSKEVRSRKGEFREFLRTSLAQDMRRQQALQEGVDAKETPLPPVTEAELDKYIKELRRDVAGLNSQIRRFFDIAPVSSASFAGKNLDWLDATKNKQTEIADTYSSDSPYAIIGPPKTHPSAGLSYTRTASKLHNHPLFGPQRAPTIVDARIIQPQKSSVMGNTTPLLGVGGFVTNVPLQDNSFDVNASSRRTNTIGSTTAQLVPGVLKIEPGRPGGSKVWVEPLHAHVDTNGKVQLTVQKADVEAVAVKEGKTDKLEEMKPKTRAFSGSRAIGFYAGAKETVSSRIIDSKDKPIRGADAYGLL
ncbi:hypothetical protein GLAREA_08941 [Glarea lozoyensis ATCC 20868]|uniref:Uncharacterized protein n=1 Tax=Glarea lozoyensis (strain ATCC 20868 / MF5171) TaxID=1116229 RepID=S3EF37_GLAL2|nr:uncharacterized protein GLAREA_08941 [Glarea lozoyensis ATCC 20868]EPE36778.1 hypothetical protein GLAREA_08941 [Glarea lozoyensis ATCC 20868]